MNKEITMSRHKKRAVWKQSNQTCSMAYCHCRVFFYKCHEKWHSWYIFM